MRLVLLVLIVLSALLFVISKTKPEILAPLTNIKSTLFGQSSDASDTNATRKLQEENLALQSRIAKLELLEKDVAALNDQFKTTTPHSNYLLPARIVGRVTFIPGISKQERFVLDRGKRDFVVLGAAVVYKDNLVGRITEVNDSYSRVDLVSNASSSFIAKAVKTNAQGIIKGQGQGEILFENVNQSDQLEAGDFVVSAGEQDEKGQGLPPDIIIGKIVSIEKKPSAVFQSARLKSLLEFEKLSLVFIVIQ